MNFQPIIPMGGYAGWMFLNRTLETQQKAQQNSLKSDTDYFAGKIGEVRTAEDLMSDRRLLKVALGAFGLENDINSKFFIRKVLEEGVLNRSSLANKLSDKSYYKLSEAFGFGEGLPPRTILSGFADEIIGAYRQHMFEVGVGETNEDFRLALNAQRELVEIADGSMSDDAKWFSVMGSPRLRSVFETALGLPASFGSLDIDDQLDTFRNKAKRTFGSGEVSHFSDPEALDKLVKTFLLRSELASGVQSLSSANTALILLGANG
ncbi:MAG: DUF1217 domain-containing protein [Tropicimonas sp.]|uniref:DUF1217 domain-containing protein n=1 Tax=Tropicimonas sp. TaxID=2067044 RepID=UPI003A8A8051